MATDTLSDTAIRKAKPGDKPRKLADGGGLFLLLQPNGSRWWRFKYRIDGKEKLLSLGVYPDVGLADARRRRDEARALVAAGTDPSASRQTDKAARTSQAEAQRLAAAGEPLPGTFEHVARRWHNQRTPEWAPSYANKVIGRLEGKVFPHIGARPVADIQPPELLAILRRLESEGIVETAHRVRDTMSEVFRFAVAEGLTTSDPARDLARALRKHTTKHLASITDPARFGELLRAVDTYRGTPIVRSALKLAALVFLRPGAELRQARWEEFDLDAGTWLVPAGRMKRGKDGKANGPDHLVPLSRQAVEVLRDLQKFTGSSALVFRGERHRDKPISENTLNAALDAMGFTNTEHRAHGFRASARTMLHERCKIDPAVIEAQLAHAVPDALGKTYNRTQFVDDRRQMMQTWADYLDRLREGAQVLSFKAA